MKHLLVAAVFAVISGAAIADDNPPPQGPGPDGGMDGAPMHNLTAEQQACIQAYGCEMPTRDSAPTPGEKPTAPDGKSEGADCMRQAMESCGIQMPEPPAKPDGDRKAR